jgi:hypothetical protein
MFAMVVLGMVVFVGVGHLGAPSAGPHCRLQRVRKAPDTRRKRNRAMLGGSHAGELGAMDRCQGG